MKKIFHQVLSLLCCINIIIAQTNPPELPWNPLDIVIDSKDNLYIEFERILKKIKTDGSLSYESEDFAKGFRDSVAQDAELMVIDSIESLFMTHPQWNSLLKLAPDGTDTTFSITKK